MSDTKNKVSAYKIDFLPIILGSDENAYGMARAFHERYNIVSKVLCRQVLVPSRYSKIMNIEQIADFDEEKIFVDNIKRVAEERTREYKKLLLVPCSDRYIELAARNSNIIEEYFCNKFIPHELLQRFATKEKFYETCEAYDLPYPKTVICEKRDRPNILEKLPFDFPVIVKADNSNSYDFMHSEFDGKKKVFFVESPSEYLDIIDKMNASNYNGKLIIQEFIPGGDTSMRVLNCFSDNEGRVKLMSLGHVLLEEYTPLRLGNYAAIMTDFNYTVFKRIQHFLEDIKYTGFSNFDMKFDARSGEYKLFEINPRQGASSFFVTAAGYNLAEFLVNNCVYKENFDIVYARSDMLWLTVPKKIIYGYVDNEQVLERAKELIGEGKFKYTLLYKKDRGFKRRLRIKLYYRRHIRDYEKYFFKKNKE